MSPANQLSSLKKVNFSGAFQWFCIESSPWPHLWSFSRMTITDYFTKERSDQNLPYHNLSAILSCSRQFEASYIENVLRNWRAEYSMIQECFESFSGRLSVVVVVVFFGFRDNFVPRVHALPTKKAQGRQIGEGGPKGRQPWFFPCDCYRWFSPWRHQIVMSK